MRFRTMALAGILSFGALAADMSSAHAQCCGGGGGYIGWRPFGRSYGGGYGCGMMMGGMGMGGMNMGGMPMPAAQAPAASMPGMNMNGNAAPAAAPDRALASPPPAPAAAGATYYCPMHPGVMSTFPANCPTCGMALKRR